MAREQLQQCRSVPLSGSRGPSSSAMADSMVGEVPSSHTGHHLFMTYDGENEFFSGR